MAGHCTESHQYESDGAWVTRSLRSLVTFELDALVPYYGALGSNQSRLRLGASGSRVVGSGKGITPSLRVDVGRMFRFTARPLA